MQKTLEPETPPTERGTPSVLLGLFLTAMSVLLLEVALTRVFAILMWHHFAYMVVSLALLGFGASGSILTAFPRVGSSGAFRAGMSATAFGAFTLVAFFALTRLKIDSLEIWKEPSNFLKLFLTYALLSVPFLFAGLAIGITLSRHPKDIGRLYFVDLVGSAAGGAIAPWILGEVGSTAAVAIAAALAGVGGVAYQFSNRRRPGRILAASMLALVLVATAIGFSGGGLGIPKLTWEIPFAPNKGASSYFKDAKPDRTIPSSTAQVDVAVPVVSPVTIGGQFGDVDAQMVELRAVTQDGTAPTALHKGSSRLSDFPCLDDSQAGSAYIAWRSRSRTPGDVLVIGAGGGIDVMVALAFGSKRVTAVDINRAMIRMVKEDYADYIGNLFSDPRVDLVHGEGRAYLRHSGRKFDVIQLSGVDTFTALSTGAYTLSESYLYTVEGVKEIYAHLNDEGIVTWSRFMLTWPHLPRESIRLANIAREALDLLGVKEPWRHICVLQAHDAASTMIKKTPFTSEELAALRNFAEKQRFMGLVFDPERPLGGPYEKGRTPDHQIGIRAKAAPGLLGLAEANSTEAQRKAVVSGFQSALRLAADGDSSASDRAIDDIALAFGVSVDAASAQLKALRADRTSFLELRERKNEGFLAAQRDFATLVKGDQGARDALMRDYVFDLEPSTDDKPFFFDYFRLDRFFQDAKRGGKWSSEYHPEFPVGHLVMLISLVQIVVLAVIMILLPLRKLRRSGVAAPRRARTFAYFAALGLGFMFVEIALMQKFILFLGHPTYSLSVVLCTMLAFSGLGALISTRVRNLTPATFKKLLVAILGLLALEAIAVNYVLPPLLGLDMSVRVLVTLALLAPLAVAMGMPFPLGIRVLEAHAPALIPWGWAVNGFLSVFASMAATLTAMQVGFTAVFVTAAFIYAAGLLLVPIPGLAARTQPR